MYAWYAHHYGRGAAQAQAQAQAEAQQAVEDAQAVEVRAQSPCAPAHVLFIPAQIMIVIRRCKRLS